MIVIIDDPHGPRRTSWRGLRIYLEGKGGVVQARKAVLAYLRAQGRPAVWAHIAPSTDGGIDWVATVPRSAKETKTKEKPCDPT